MSIEPPPLRDVDDPWRRLAWTLPSAILVWAAVLWAFALFMHEPRQRSPQAPPVEMQIVELPPESSPAAQKESKPVPPPPKPEPRPAPRPTQPVPKALPPRLSDQSPRALQPARPAPEPPAPPAPAPAQTPTQPPAEGSGKSLSASGGAQAIVRPMPQIPDELREEALHAVVRARFHVAADGSATVELAQPSPDPRLNRLLLDTFAKWKFFPAVKDGQPVASTEEITIHIDVK